MAFFWLYWEIAVAESDLVADVTIASWLGETNSEKNDIYKTFFTAKINSVLKGESTDEIVLM